MTALGRWWVVGGGQRAEDKRQALRQWCSGAEARGQGSATSAPSECIALVRGDEHKQEEE